MTVLTLSQLKAHPSKAADNLLVGADWRLSRGGGKQMKGAVRATVLAACLLGSVSHATADLRDDLAKQFNVEARYFILNLPPRPGGWPGSIYTPDMRFPVERGKPDDPAVERGPMFDMAAGLSFEVGGQAQVGVSRLFGLSAKANDIAVVRITFRNARISDLTLAQVRERVLRLPDDQRRPPGPVIVYRAYEGTPTLILGRKSDVSAEAWASFRKEIAEAGVGAQAASGESLVLQAKENMVFAFEIVQASDLQRITKWIDRGDPNITTPASGTISVVENPMGAVVVQPQGSGASPGVVFSTSVESSVSEVVRAEAAAGRVLSSYLGLTRIPADVFEQANPNP